jgi:hypothetical protein
MHICQPTRMRCILTSRCVYLATRERTGLQSPDLTRHGNLELPSRKVDCMNETADNLLDPVHTSLQTLKKCAARAKSR